MKPLFWIVSFTLVSASMLLAPAESKADGRHSYGKVAIAVDGFYLSFGASNYDHYPKYRTKVIHYYPHRYYYKYPYKHHYKHHRHYYKHHRHYYKHHRPHYGRHYKHYGKHHRYYGRPYGGHKHWKGDRHRGKYRGARHDDDRRGGRRHHRR